jgi:hypothetical protein
MPAMFIIEDSGLNLLPFYSICEDFAVAADTQKGGHPKFLILPG